MNDATKKMRALAKALRRQGFEVEIARCGHYRVIAPSGHKVNVACTPTGTRAYKNQVARLKRIGYQP